MRTRQRTVRVSADVVAMWSDNISLMTTARLRIRDLVQLVIDMGGRDVLVLTQILNTSPTTWGGWVEVSGKVMAVAEAEDRAGWRL